MSDQPTTVETSTTTETPTTETPTATAAVEPERSLLDPSPSFDPEKLTFGEGFEKNELYNDFVALATESQVSQEFAQKMIDLYSRGAKSSAEASEAAWRAQNEKWQEEVKADPEVGGAKLAGVLQSVSRVMDNAELTHPKFREALSFTGAGNHPAIVITLSRWVKALSEGSAVAGSPPGTNGQRPSIADALYPGGPRTTIYRGE